MEEGRFAVLNTEEDRFMFGPDAQQTFEDVAMAEHVLENLTTTDNGVIVKVEKR